jgi:hypothetical protein
LPLGRKTIQQSAWQQTFFCVPKYTAQH